MVPMSSVYRAPLSGAVLSWSYPSAALHSGCTRTEGVSVTLPIDTVSWSPFRSMVTLSSFDLITTYGISASVRSLECGRSASCSGADFLLPVLCSRTPGCCYKIQGRSVPQLLRRYYTLFAQFVFAFLRSRTSLQFGVANVIASSAGASRLRCWIGSTAQGDR